MKDIAKIEERFLAIQNLGLFRCTKEFVMSRKRGPDPEDVDERRVFDALVELRFCVDDSFPKLGTRFG